MKQRLWPWLKWAGLSLSIGSVVIAILMMWQFSPKETPEQSVDGQQQQTSVEAPVLVERKDGKILWQLRAEEASQQLDGNMLLSMPTLTLYTESKKEIQITGLEATFEPLDRNVSFRKQVRVKHDQWLLKAELMTYASSNDTIHIPGKFELDGGDISAHGKDLTLDRPHETLHVEKGVSIRDEKPAWNAFQGEQP